MEKAKSSLSETKKAYADSVCSDKHKYGSPTYEKCMKRANKQRNLSWGGTPFMSVEQFEKHAKVVGAYNEFDPIKVSKKLAIFKQKIKVKLAREGSPAIYVEGRGDVLREVATVFEGYADEINIGPSEGKGKKLRIWFD